MRYNLIDICDFQGGSQPPKEQWKDTLEDGYIRMLQIRDFTQNYVKQEYVKISNSIKTCKCDDILIARYGASIGKILTGLEGAYNVAIMKTIPNEQILSKQYLYYYLNSSIFQNYINNVGSRAAQAGFNKDELGKLEINVPSLEEQQNIVEKLKKVNEIIDFKKSQLNDLDELIKSLFVEMFGDPIENTKNITSKKLGDICDIYRGASPRPIEKYLDGNVPWIKIGDATKDNALYLYKTKEHITEEGAKKSRLVKKGALIFANCGVSLGFARIIQFDGCIHDGWLAFENFEKELNPIFFMQALNFCTEYFRRIAPDGTQPNLNTNIMKNYVQIVPSMEEQLKFMNIAKQIDKQKFEIQKSLDEMNNLYESLMNKYFG